MAQVVTNENMQEFIQNRSVPEFKAPDAKPADAPAAGEVAIEPSKEGSKPATDSPARGADGKFVKADEKVDDTAAKAADDDDTEDADLPERVRRQIGKKHRAMKEAEEFAREEYRERKAAEDRAAALEQELNALKSKSGPKPEEDADAPRQDDFNTVGEWAKAVSKYEVAKALKAERLQSEQSRQTQAIQNAKQAFGEKVAAVAKEIPDYYEVVGAADVDVPPHIASHIVESGEVGVRLGYHLAKHPEELDRIMKLSPIRAIAELGKLETQLEKKPEPAKPAASAKPAVSRAPAPITPLDGSSTSVPKPENEMTFQELRARREAERAAGKYKR